MALEVLSGKVTPEVKAQFQEAQANGEAMTFNAFMELLLEAYLNPKTKPVEVPRPTAEQLQEIQLNVNEIGRLKAQIDFNNLEIEELKEEKRELAAALDNVPDHSISIGENQELITIPPIIALILDKEAVAAKRKSGKEFFNRGEILTNCFWETIKEGRYVPFLIWNNREISEAVKSLQKAE